MLRLLAVFLPLFISFLFEACSKQGSALLPGEIIVNASELPGPIQEWKTDLACERCLTINLDNPSLPWFRIAEGISEAYAHGVNNLRLKRGMPSRPLLEMEFAGIFPSPRIWPRNLIRNLKKT